MRIHQVLHILAWLAAPTLASAQILDWAHSLGISGESEINVVRTDASDNVYVLGIQNNSGSVDLDPGPGSHVLSWNFGILPGSGWFVAKYDSTGLYQWGCRADEIRAMAVSPAGDMVVLANIQGSWDADPGPGVHMLYATNGLGIARWSTNGTFISAFVLEGAGSRHCAIDDLGDIYVYGSFTGVVDADPGPGEHLLTSNGYNDVWLSRYDAQNALVWAHSIGGPGQEYPSDLLLHTGRILVTMRTVGDISVQQFDVDPGPGVQLTNFGQNQGAVLMEFLLDGTYQRHRSFDWPVEWRAPIIGRLPDGGVALAGAFSGTAHFVTSDSAFTMSSAAGYDAFIHRLDGSWGPMWLDTFSAYGNESIFSMVPSKDGAVLVCGFFTHSIDVDPGPGELIYTNTPPGDAWIGSYCYSDGSWIWSALINGDDRDLLYSMTWTQADALIIGGKASQNADLGIGGPPHMLSTTASSSAIVARYRYVNTQCSGTNVGIDNSPSDGGAISVSVADGLMNVRMGGEGRRLALYDMQGRLLLDRSVYTDQAIINAHNYSPGAYVIVVYSATGRSALRVVIH